MADVPGLDEFAQTRGADDLFDDEIIPVTAEEQQVQPVPQPPPHPEPEPQARKQAESKLKLDTRSHGLPEDGEAAGGRRHSGPVYGDAPRARGGERRGRGRGRGRGGRARESKRSDGARNIGDNGTAESGAREEEDKAEAGEKGEEGQEEPAEPHRVRAVRGDRSATGGVKKVLILLLPCVEGVELTLSSPNSQKKSYPGALPPRARTQPRYQPRMPAQKQTRPHS